MMLGRSMHVIARSPWNAASPWISSNRRWRRSSLQVARSLTTWTIKLCVHTRCGCWARAFVKATSESSLVDRILGKDVERGIINKRVHIMVIRAVLYGTRDVALNSGNHHANYDPFDIVLPWIIPKNFSS